MSSDLVTTSFDFSAPPVNQVRFVGDYVLLRTISEGAGATVSLARHLLTATDVVIKAITRKDCPEFPQEAHCLQTLNHPNIISLFEVIATQDMVYLVMEHMRGGDLRAHLETYGRLTEREARAAFRQLVSALQYCHHRGIVHRDLKPANILLEANNVIKLADFDFAKETKGQKLSSCCGTICYMAPEVFKQHDYDGCKADVWSLGVTLYNTVMGKLPFWGNNLERQREKILAGKFGLPYFLSREGQSFLNRLLTVDPNQRPTMEEVMEDPWLNMGQEEEPLRPYIEPPQEDLDPHVTAMMLDLGFKKNKIEESVTKRTFDKVMGTYRILRVTQTKMPGRTIRVRPSPEARSIFSSQEVGESFDGKSEQPSNPLDCPGSKVTTPPPNLVETISTTPPADPIEFRTATSNPVLKRGSGGSPAMRNSRSSSTISSRGVPEGAAHELGLQTGQAEEETKAIDCPGSNVTTPPPSLVKTISTTPPADPPEFRIATPSPVLKRGPGGFPTKGKKSRKSTTSRGRARGGAAHERGLHTGQAEEETKEIDCPGSNANTPPGNLVETISTTRPADPPEFRIATPSPVLKRRPGGFPTKGKKSRRSTISRGRARGGAAHDRGLHTGQAEEETEDTECPGLNVTTPTHSLVESISTSPQPHHPEFRSATPSPVLKLGPVVSTTMCNKIRRSTISRGRAQGGAAHERGLHTGQAEEETEDTECPGSNRTTPPPSMEAIHATPPIKSTEFRTDTPSPVLSTIIRGGAIGGATHESGLHNGQGDGGSPVSPSGHSQGLPGWVRRAWRFISKWTCCGSPTKKGFRRTKVQPM